MASLRLVAFISVLVLILSLVLTLYQSSSAQTYCYASVKTLSEPTSEGNCFRVSRSGTFSKVFSLVPSSAEKYSRPGHVAPGLWDGHGHLMQYGEMLHSVYLFGLSSIDDARERIHKYATKNPEEGSRDQWIRGLGWDQAAFGEIMPTAVRGIPSAFNPMKGL